MKRIVLSLAILTALSVSSFVQGQERDSNRKAPHHLRVLNLSAQQESQIDALREEYRGKREALNAQYETDMKKILTPDQLATFEASRIDRSDKGSVRDGRKDRYGKKNKKNKGNKNKHRGGNRGDRLNNLDADSKQKLADLRANYDQQKAAIEKSRVAPDTQKEQLEVLRKQYMTDVQNVLNSNKAANQSVERPHSVDAWMSIAPDTAQ